MRAPKKRRPSVNIMPMMTSVGTRLLTEARKMTAARAMRERKARRYLRSRIRARRPLSWAVVVIVVMRDCRRVFFLMIWVVREEDGRMVSEEGSMAAEGMVVVEEEGCRGRMGIRG